jgi:hypothetical protein
VSPAEQIRTFWCAAWFLSGFQASGRVVGYEEGDVRRMAEATKKARKAGTNEVR